MMLGLILSIGLIIGVGVLVTLVRKSEKKAWNKGICTNVNCKGKFKSFDVDSQGGRGYKCNECGRTIWISWSVDK